MRPPALSRLLHVPFLVLVVLSPLVCHGEPRNFNRYATKNNTEPLIRSQAARSGAQLLVQSGEEAGRYFVDWDSSSVSDATAALREALPSLAADAIKTVYSGPLTAAVVVLTKEQKETLSAVKAVRFIEDASDVEATGGIVLQTKRFVIAPYSRCEAAEGKTAMSQTTVQTHDLLTAVIQALEEDERRIFHWSSVSLFSSWWAKQDARAQDLCRRLVRRGQLVFVGGTWSAPGNAVSPHTTLLDNVAMGHHWLYQTFGIVPTVAWDVQNAGIGAGIAALYRKLGFDALVTRRVPLPPPSPTSTSTFLWTPEEGEHGILTHVSRFDPLPSSYVSYDRESNSVAARQTSPWRDARTLADILRAAAREQPGERVILVTFGDEFLFRDARADFARLEAALHILRQEQALAEDAVVYGSVSVHFRALAQRTRATSDSDGSRAQIPATTKHNQIPRYDKPLLPFASCMQTENADELQSSRCPEYWNVQFFAKSRERRLAWRVDSLRRSAEILVALAETTALAHKETPHVDNGQQLVELHRKDDAEDAMQREAAACFSCESTLRDALVAAEEEEDEKGTSSAPQLRRHTANLKEAQEQMVEVHRILSSHDHLSIVSEPAPSLSQNERREAEDANSDASVHASVGAAARFARLAAESSVYDLVRRPRAPQANRTGDHTTNVIQEHSNMQNQNDRATLLCVSKEENSAVALCKDVIDGKSVGIGEGEIPLVLWNPSSWKTKDTHTVLTIHDLPLSALLRVQTADGEDIEHSLHPLSLTATQDGDNENVVRLVLPPMNIPPFGFRTVFLSFTARKSGSKILSDAVDEKLLEESEPMARAELWCSFSSCVNRSVFGVPRALSLSGRRSEAEGGGHVVLQNDQIAVHFDRNEFPSSGTSHSSPSAFSLHSIALRQQGIDAREAVRTRHEFLLYPVAASQFLEREFAPIGLPVRYQLHDDEQVQCEIYKRIAASRSAVWNEGSATVGGAGASSTAHRSTPDTLTCERVCSGAAPRLRVRITKTAQSEELEQVFDDSLCVYTIRDSSTGAVVRHRGARAAQTYRVLRGARSVEVVEEAPSVPGTQASSLLASSAGSRTDAACGQYYVDNGVHFESVTPRCGSSAEVAASVVPVTSTALVPGAPVALAVLVDAPTGTLARGPGQIELLSDGAAQRMHSSRVDSTIDPRQAAPAGAEQVRVVYLLGAGEDEGAVLARASRQLRHPVLAFALRPIHDRAQWLAVHRAQGSDPMFELDDRIYLESFAMVSSVSVPASQEVILHVRAVANVTKPSIDEAVPVLLEPFFEPPFVIDNVRETSLLGSVWRMQSREIEHQQQQEEEEQDMGIPARDSSLMHTGGAVDVLGPVDLRAGEYRAFVGTLSYSSLLAPESRPNFLRAVSRHSQSITIALVSVLVLTFFVSRKSGARRALGKQSGYARVRQRGSRERREGGRWWSGRRAHSSSDLSDEEDEEITAPQLDDSDAEEEAEYAPTAVFRGEHSSFVGGDM